MVDRLRLQLLEDLTGIKTPKKVTAYNQAKAVRENVTVTADRLIAYYRKKKLAIQNQSPPKTPILNKKAVI